MNTAHLPDRASHRGHSSRTVSAMLSCLFCLACVAEPPPPSPVRPVLLATAVAAGGARHRFSATIEARHQSELGFRVPGKLHQRLVEVGTPVREGQPLARLDSDDYRLARAAADSQAHALNAEAEQAERDAQRLADLAADDAVAQAEAERQTARARAAAARSDQARAQLAQAEDALAYTVLRAPYAGVITAVRGEVGQVVGAAQPLFDLADDRELEVVVDLPETLRMKVAQFAAGVSLDADDTAIRPLRLRELAASATLPGRTYRARFALPAATHQALGHLALGMSVTLHLSEPATDNAVMVPAEALLMSGDRASVWIPESDHHLRRVPVVVLRFTPGEAIVSGIAAGTRVVSAGVQTLDPAQRVSTHQRSDPFAAQPRGHRGAPPAPDAAKGDGMTQTRGGA